jgi:glycosyltransferase involved in cell wall biosynthesis
MPSVLCIAYHFPPAADSGTHRTRALVRYLPANGWNPVVVTAGLGPSASEDASLLEGLPPDLAVYRTLAPDLLSWANRVRAPLRGLNRLGAARADKTALSPDAQPGVDETRPGHRAPLGRALDWLSWWLQIPDLTIGWLPWGLAAARRAAKRHDCRVIYSTAPFWTAHLIGLLTKSATGLPWVADFRDPWRANPFRRLMYRSVDCYDAWLEQKVVRGADWVICNSDYIRDDFVARYPDRAERFVTIPNGFDPEDFAGLEPQRPVGYDQLVLTHAGVFYGRRSPEPIFRAVRLVQERDAARRKLCLQLVGPPTYEGTSLKEMAARYNIEDLVRLPGKVGHGRALELMKGSDILLLIGFNGQGADLQVPAKFFEYLGVGRPVLALAPDASAIGEVMRRSGVVGELCNPEDPEAIAAAILRLGEAVRGPTATSTANGVNGHDVASFHRREQVGQISRLLRSLECPFELAAYQDSATTGL